MRIVGLDVSLRHTGVATDEGTRVIEPSDATTGTDRLFWIRAQVLDAVHALDEGSGPRCNACHCWGTHPDLIVMEDYAFSKGDAHAHELGEIGGVLKVEFVYRLIPFVVPKPSTRAKVATGKGNASKNEVLAEAIKRLSYDGHSFDEADALWLRELGLHAYGLGTVELPAKNLESVAAVQWPELRTIGAGS